MNYVIVCMHMRLCVHVHAHVYFLYTCRYVYIYIYMCANVYMCASVTRTHVYICVRRREMGVYITRMRSFLFYRAFYFIIDHTMGSYLVYICAPMCMCVHVYASISIYIHAFTYAYVRTCIKYMHA